MKNEKETLMAWLNNPHFTQEQKVDKIIDDFTKEKQNKRFWQRFYLFGSIGISIVLICIQAQCIRVLKSIPTCEPTNYSAIITETQDSTIEDNCRSIMYLEQVPLQIRKDICRVLKNQAK